MSYSYNTCRHCHEVGADGFVKYGTRHYMHYKCYLDHGKKLTDLHPWQVEKFPYYLLKERGLLADAERIIGGH